MNKIFAKSLTSTLRKKAVRHRSVRFLNIKIKDHDRPDNPGASYLQIGIVSCGAGFQPPSVLVYGYSKGDRYSSIMFNCGAGSLRAFKYFKQHWDIPYPTVTACTKDSADNISELHMHMNLKQRQFSVFSPGVLATRFRRLYAKSIGYKGWKTYDGTDYRGDAVMYRSGPFTINSVQLYPKGLKGSKRGTPKSNTELAAAAAYVLTTEKSYANTLLIDKIMDFGLKDAASVKKIMDARDEDIRLRMPDGRYVTPKQFKPIRMQDSKIVVLECPSEYHIDDVLKSKVIFPMKEDAFTVKVVVHIAPYSVIQSPQYQHLIQRFGPKTKHILLHEKTAPHYQPDLLDLHARLNLLSSEIFPPLLPGIPPSSWLRSEDLESQIIHGENGMLLDLLTNEGKITIERENKDLEYIQEKVRSSIHRSTLDTALKEIETEIEKEKHKYQDLPDYPEVCFLGTACDVSALRNLSSILVYTSPQTAVMLDCGLGTLNQLYQAYGSRLNETLMDIKVVFISHRHLDHHEGLMSVILQRKKAFDLCGREYENLLLVLTRDLEYGIQGYFDFYSVPMSLVSIRCIRTGHYEEGMSHVSNRLNLKNFQPVPVVHCSSACGILLDFLDGFKLVYSGDTSVSHSLIKAGLDCNLLIHECTYDLLQEDMQSQHCNYDDVIYVSEEMNAEYTVLTHFGSFTHRLFSIDKKDMFVANDFMRVKYKDLYKLNFIQKRAQVLLSHDSRDTKKRMKLIFKRHRYEGGNIHRRKEIEGQIEHID